VVHFTSIHSNYKIALKITKHIGGKIFNNKQFSDGIVFRGQDGDEVRERIKTILPEENKPRQEPSNLESFIIYRALDVSGRPYFSINKPPAKCIECSLVIKASHWYEAIKEAPIAYRKYLKERREYSK